MEMRQKILKMIFAVMFSAGFSYSQQEIVIEAEDFISRSEDGYWKAFKEESIEGITNLSSLAVSGIFLDAPSKPAEKSVTVTYNLVVNETGEYDIYLLGLGATNDTDSAFLTIRGILSEPVLIESRGSDYNEAKFRTSDSLKNISVSKGVYELQILSAENHFMVSRIALVASGKQSPYLYASRDKISIGENNYIKNAQHYDRKSINSKWSYVPAEKELVGLTNETNAKHSGIQFLPNQRVGENSDYIEYDFEIRKRGRYYLAVQCSGFDGSTDSAYVTAPSLFDGIKQVGYRTTDIKDISWRNVAVINDVKPGIHTVRISNRENNFYINRVALRHSNIAIPGLEPEKNAIRESGDYYYDVFKQDLVREKYSGYLATTPDEDVIQQAWTAYHVYKRENDEAMLSLALEMYDNFLDIRLVKTVKFSEEKAFGQLTKLLNTDALLNSERRARASRCAESVMDQWIRNTNDRTEHQRYINNISIAYACAASTLNAVFPDLPQSELTSARLNEMKSFILSVGNLDENCSSYNCIGLSFFFDLATEDGWFNEIMDHPRFRKKLEGMRDIFSSNGWLPEWGDAYFYYDKPYLNAAYVFERAARYYKERSYLTVAQRIISDRNHHLDYRNFATGLFLINLEPLPVHMSDSERPLSFVAKRHNGLGLNPDREFYDKLVLKTGDSPQDHMVMMDLYGWGVHGHFEKKGGVAYYEAGGVPLFHGLGRRGGKSATITNCFWYEETGKSFLGVFGPNEWHTVRVPTSRLVYRHDETRFSTGRGLTLRTLVTNSDTLNLDNLLLRRSDGTSLQLSDCDNVEDFRTAMSGSVRLDTSLKTEGRASIRLEPLSLFENNFHTLQYDTSFFEYNNFSTNEYESMEFDFYYTGRLLGETSMREIVTVDGNISFPIKYLDADVSYANVEEEPNGVLGKVLYRNYRYKGNKLKKEIKLLNSGALVIKDTFTLDGHAEEFKGGQLWQMYEVESEGEDWFCSKSAGEFQRIDDSLKAFKYIVKFFKPSGTSVERSVVSSGSPHILRADGSKIPNFNTIHSSSDLVAGQSSEYLVAILPIEPDADPALEQQRITFQMTHSGYNCFIDEIAVFNTPSYYESWILDKGDSDDAPESDADSDGFPNIVEYAFNLDPTVESPSSALDISYLSNEGDRFIRLEFPRRIDSSLTYRLMDAGDDFNFQKSTDQPRIIIDGDSTGEMTTDYIDVNLNPQGRRFFKIEVE